MLNFGIKFADLYEVDGLQIIDARFLKYVQTPAPHLYDSLIAARQHQYPSAHHSQLIIDLAIYLESFLAELFAIEHDVGILQSTHYDYHHMAEFKHRIIQKRILPKFQQHNWNTFIESDYIAEKSLNDMALIQAWYQAHNASDNKIADRLETYIAWRCLNLNADDTTICTSVLFTRPQSLNFDQLFAYTQDQQTIYIPHGHVKPRDGFNLIDPGQDPFHAYDHAYYCLKCHKTKRDSCAYGLRDKSGQIAVNPLGNTLNGCPLEQKISEMNVVKHRGYCLAALAIITIDNPMVAATGHRICNDCEKACIFQKQTSVDVPSIETQILIDVLTLPWGFEIYSLLTRWNPLNFIQHVPYGPTGHNILIAGMGPAGFTLAHYLLRLGHQVLGIDAFKIEPLPKDWWRRTVHGHVNFQPICDASKLSEPLSTRAAYGFGGVAEYGITPRWNKNFLTIIRLILMRHPHFRLSGQTRFGSAITLSSAQALGFDHVALCLGSGKPNIPQIPNVLAKGVSAASDFLMNLQAGGAARKNSLANLQIRLPIVVIGGGLTAVDAATEALAYYQIQIEKFFNQYEQLCASLGGQIVTNAWSHEEQTIAQEFIMHARLLRQLHARGHHNKVIATLQAWGGVQIVYRKSLQQAPAYTTNADEIKQALVQGVGFVENTTLKDIITDAHGAIQSVKVDSAGITKTMPVRTLLLATGIGANTYYSREYAHKIDWTCLNFQDPAQQRPFINNSIAPHYVSAFGDLDPEYSGSVVKAMASAKHGYLKIDTALKHQVYLADSNFISLDFIQQQLQTHIISNITLSNGINQLTIKAPLAAQHYRVGQFFKLQNFEKSEYTSNNMTPVMKGIACTPIHVDKDEGLLTFVIRALGASTAFTHTLKPGDPVALMGPTGTAYTVQAHQNVLIITDDFYGLTLLPIIDALQQVHSHIHIYGIENLDKNQLKSMLRSDQYLTFYNNLATLAPLLTQVDQIIVNCPVTHMQDLQILITAHASTLKQHCQIYASINAPMQCMMKEICGQCLQQKIDTVTGEIHYFYACAEQWQPLLRINLDILQGRLEQNSLMAKLNHMWFTYSRDSTSSS